MLFRAGPAQHWAPSSCWIPLSSSCWTSLSSSCWISLSSSCWISLSSSCWILLSSYLLKSSQDLYLLSDLPITLLMRRLAFLDALINERLRVHGVRASGSCNTQNACVPALLQHTKCLCTCTPATHKMLVYLHSCNTQNACVPALHDQHYNTQTSTTTHRPALQHTDQHYNTQTSTTTHRPALQHTDQHYNTQTSTRTHTRFSFLLKTQLMKYAHQEVVAFVIHAHTDLHELPSVAYGEFPAICNVLGVMTEAVSLRSVERPYHSYVSITQLLISPGVATAPRARPRSMIVWALSGPQTLTRTDISQLFTAAGHSYFPLISLCCIPRRPLLPSSSLTLPSSPLTLPSSPLTLPSSLLTLPSSPLTLTQDSLLEDTLLCNLSLCDKFRMQVR
ncbi:hypothetical protein FHG87_015679 [Trinorchestia longiramus]|nr:hypothetical protein FHG87_015679 [Trinorchestia longiramus]